MPALPQLIDAGEYQPETFNFRGDPAGCAYWADAYLRELDGTLLDAIRETSPNAGDVRLAEFAAAYRATFRDLAARPEAARLFDFDAARSRLLNEHGFPDPYAMLKAREDAAALALLPEVIARLDRLTGRAHWEAIARGMLAGNLFDVGAPDAYARHQAHAGDFARACSELPPRPWRFDGLDAWLERVAPDSSSKADSRPAGARSPARDGPESAPWRHAALFVDNSGGDMVLGMVPLVRALQARGVRVTLVPNSGPALNDVTAAELAERILRSPVVEGVLNTAALRVAASGASSPYLDLRRLAAECVSAVADADLLVLHGMGRSLETNFHARFRCDVLRTAVFKDAYIAARLGAAPFDCAFRFDAARPAD